MEIENIFLFGGSGTLGSQMKADSLDYGIAFFSPSSRDCNIEADWQVDENIKNFKGNTVVHCAAFTDVKSAEKNPIMAARINVLGTFNVLQSCIKYKKRIVYISTDYVFDGKKGNYKTSDCINPLSSYAKTKAAGELLVRTYHNSLIIRTSFYGKDFPYKKALVDQWTSKDYVDVISPKILQCIQRNELGIKNIGSPRRTVYEIAKERAPNIIAISKKELNFPIPTDTSLYLGEE